MLFPVNASGGRCDTFICYRSDAGANWGKIIYTWMTEDKNSHYGRVYYSQFVDDANFINDIPTMLRCAENIVIVITNEFTKNFPQTKADFLTRDIVTAQEIHTIMARMRSARETMGQAEHMPRLILLHPGKLNEQDRKNLELLASDFGSRQDREMTDWLVNQFWTAGIHEIDARGTDALIHAHLRAYLDCTAITKDLIRFRAATTVRIHKLPFMLVPQTMHIEGKQSRNTDILSLAQSLIHMPRPKESLPYNRLAIISGDGGMGKTTQLQHLCYTAQQKALQDYDPRDTLHIYLPAHRMNDYAHTPSPLYAALAKVLGFHSEPYRDTEGLHPADYTDPEEFIKNRIFDNPLQTDHAPCLLCIDGLDEIENITIQHTYKTLLNHLSAELPQILRMGVAVILTSRSSTLVSNGSLLDCIHGQMNLLSDMIDRLPAQFRPGPKTRLSRLLSTPFYFTMYYNTVSPDGTAPSEDSAQTDAPQPLSALKLGDLYNRDMELFYHHTDPTTPGELIWNYVMRHIVKRSGTNSMLQYTDLCGIFYLMYAMPRVAAAALTKRQLSEDMLEKLYAEAVSDFSANGWYPFWKLDRIPEYTAASLGVMPSAADFLVFCTRIFPLLKKEEQPNCVTYRFSHGIMLEFFAACDVVNSIVQISRKPGLPDKSILPITKVPLPQPILKLVGEICGERRGMPYYDTAANAWCSLFDKTNNLIRRTLDALRDKPDTAVLVNNLFSILKSARTEEHRLPDLSGIDFSRLDLTKCSMSHILFSHHTPDSELCACFTGAKFDPIASFAEGHRAIIPQMSIAAQIEWLPMRLLTVDQSGCAVLWDVSLGLMLDVLHLKNDNRKHCISDIIKDKNNCVWIACDGELFRLSLDPKRSRLAVSETFRLPSQAVKHLGYREDLGIYYHSVECPLDRRLADGTAVSEEIDGRWFSDAVVNRGGDTAYYLKASEFSHSILSVNDVIKCVWNRERGRWEESTFFSYQQLRQLTGCSSFEYGHLYLSPNEKTLLLSVTCKGAARDFKCIACEFDLEKEAGQIRRYYTPVSNKGAGIHSACFGANLVYFASYLSMYSVNAQQETRLLHAGEGRLLYAQFLPDTRSFFTVTDNPIRIQFFDCTSVDNYRCTRQILPTGIRKIHGASQAFQFLPDMVFRYTDSLGYMEYPAQLRIILWHDRSQQFEIDLSNGLTRTGISKNTTLIAAPVVAYAGAPADQFSMKVDAQAVCINYLHPGRASSAIDIHCGWLFAGCDFEDADFGGKEAPDQFAHYIKAPDMPAEVPPEDMPFGTDESYLFASWDPYEDEEEDFSYE